MSKSSNPFQRPFAAGVARRLAEPRRFIQVVAGPRQVGKTTLVQQVAGESRAPVRYASADEPTLRGTEWIAQQLGVRVSAAHLRRFRRRWQLAWKRTARSVKHKQKPEAVAAKQKELEVLEKRGTRA